MGPLSIAAERARLNKPFSMATVAILKASHAVLGANPLLEAADTIEASTSAALSGAVKRPMLRYSCCCAS